MQQDCEGKGEQNREEEPWIVYYGKWYQSRYIPLLQENYTTPPSNEPLDKGQQLFQVNIIPLFDEYVTSSKLRGWGG